MLAESYVGLGIVYEQTNRPDKAEAAAIREPHVRTRPDVLETAELLGKICFHLGHVLAFAQSSSPVPVPIKNTILAVAFVDCVARIREQGTGSFGEEGMDGAASASPE